MRHVFTLVSKMEEWYFCLFVPDTLGRGRGRYAHSVWKASPKLGKLPSFNFGVIL